MGEMDDLALQWRETLAWCLGKVGNFAEFGAHAGSKHYRLAFPRHHGGARQQNVVAAQQRFLAAGPGVTRLGKRFSGDRGGVDAQVIRFDHAAIGGHVVALLQQDEIPRHQSRRFDLLHTAVPHHLDLARQQLEQSRQGTFGAVLLPERKQSVDQDHAKDGIAQHGHPLPRCAPFGDKGQRGGEPQDQGEEVGKPLEELEPEGLKPQRFDLVGAKLQQTAGGFLPGEPVWTAMQAGKCVFCGQMMDVHRRRFAERREAGIPESLKVFCRSCGWSRTSNGRRAKYARQRRALDHTGSTGLQIAANS